MSETEEHIKKTYEEQQREEAIHWFKRGVFKFLFLATAVAAGIGVGAWLFL